MANPRDFNTRTQYVEAQCRESAAENGLSVAEVRELQHVIYEQVWLESMKDRSYAPTRAQCDCMFRMWDELDALNFLRHRLPEGYMPPSVRKQKKEIYV